MSSRHMTAGLLNAPDQKEALSRAYAYAVATRAGYMTAVYSADRNGVDLRIQAGGARANNGYRERASEGAGE